MLSPREATQIILSRLPGSKVKRIVRYKNRYIAVVDTKAPGESLFDPFFSVDVNTGAFSGFSLLTDEDADEVFNLLSE